MFPKNGWYVAAWRHEIGHKPLARTLLGQPIVLYRQENGEPVALADRCCHRHAPLSKGYLAGDLLQCRYHGLMFAKNGACVHIPGQASIPTDAAVRCYPVREKWQWIWVWMGPPDAADETLLPDFHWLDDPHWVGVGERLPVRCHYQLLLDNLLDLSHLTFLHPTTLGTAAVAHTPAQVEWVHATHVRMTRWMVDTPPSPLIRQTTNLGDHPIDRWQIIDYFAPVYIRLNLGAAPTGTGAPEGDRSTAVERWNLNAITPETASSCHYFWYECRNFERDNLVLTQTFYQQVHRAFLEDIEMVEAQQQQIARDPTVPNINIAADAAPLLARRIIAQLLRAESAVSP